MGRIRDEGCAWLPLQLMKSAAAKRTDPTAVEVDPLRMAGDPRGAARWWQGRFP
jgi:hypothetical protein